MRPWACAWARAWARAVEVGGDEARAAVAHGERGHRLFGGVLERRHAPEPLGLGLGLGVGLGVGLGLGIGLWLGLRFG